MADGTWQKFEDNRRKLAQSTAAGGQASPPPRPPRRESVAALVAGASKRPPRAMSEGPKRQSLTQFQPYDWLFVVLSPDSCPQGSGISGSNVPVDHAAQKSQHLDGHHITARRCDAALLLSSERTLTGRLESVRGFYLSFSFVCTELKMKEEQVLRIR